MTRFNRYVSVTAQRPLTFVALGGVEFTPLLNALPYLRHAEFEFESVRFTHMIAGDLNRAADRDTVRSLLQHLLTAQHARLGLIDCSGSGGANRAVRAALALCGERLGKCNAYVSALLDLADSGAAVTSAAAAATAIGVESAKFDAAWQSAGDVAALHEPLCRLWREHVQAERTVVLTNGRQLVLDAGDRWTRATDWAHLEAHENRHAALIDALESTPLRGVSADELTTRFKGDLLLRLVSIFGVDLSRNVRKIVLPAGLPTHVSLGDRATCALSVRAILDPLSVSAQRAAPMLEALSSGFGACIQLSFNPVLKLDRLPLKTYYQYVLPVRPTAEGASNDVHAMFAHLPADRLLTLALDVPSRWLTDGVDARYDLDNIRLSQLPPHETTLQATFQLSAILVEGNCADGSANGEAPRGLQLLLSDERRTRQVDTLVMSNFGYFQLKARPGVWNLTLVAGRSSELYSVVASDDERAERVAQRHAVVDSFGGAFVQLHVRRNAGFETAALLDVGEGEEASKQDAAERLQRYMRGEASDGTVSNARRQYRERLAARAENGTIHVFSVVTGHLYERLLRIMMLSVRRRTQNPVKFWLLSNYLSPHFRQLLPAMARKYDFQYELVTYRWPAWLLAQTNKQRIIWGYKVLFLDVLFPLDLERVIFVDADQVVRGDLKELMALDLEGAPYALTPFCDDRPDMDGYRFWKKGYWHDQLRGRPYHISALYIIDLATFRRLAAGDIIRATYQRLVGSDPESSLANLDQDTLNVLQDQLPIYSLQQRVLWCETWCSAGTFEQALTIDLCNNPQTKEKKLDMARRIIPEWTPLDTELRTWLDEWEAGQQAETSNGNNSNNEQQSQTTTTTTTTTRVHSEL